MVKRISAVVVLSAVMLVLMASPAFAILNAKYAGNRQSSGYAAKADITWSIMDPPFGKTQFTWVSTPAVYDPAIPIHDHYGWWIQTGVYDENFIPGVYENPRSYYEYHDSAGGFHQQLLSDQPQNYYRNYEVYKRGYRLWEVWIQHALKAQGYSAADGPLQMQALAEVKSLSGHVLTKTRDAQYQPANRVYTWFNQANWLVDDPPFTLQTYGTYDDWDAYF